MGAIPAGDLSQLPRKTLQDLAKEHGLKANAKSQALAEQLQALRDGKMKGAGAAAAAPKAPAVVASPAKPVDPTRKRLSSLFATVSGPSSMSPMDAVTGSVSRKRARDEDGADDDTIDENAPLMSPLEPARRQSKIMKLASAAGAAGEAWGRRISGALDELGAMWAKQLASPRGMSLLRTGSRNDVGAAGTSGEAAGAGRADAAPAAPCVPISSSPLCPLEGALPMQTEEQKLMLFAEGKSTKPAGPQRRATMAAGAKSAAAAAAARIREYKQQRAPATALKPAAAARRPGTASLAAARPTPGKPRAAASRPATAAATSRPTIAPRAAAAPAAKPARPASAAPAPAPAAASPSKRPATAAPAAGRKPLTAAAKHGPAGGFNLKESLSRPLGYKPKTGSLRVEQPKKRPANSISVVPPKRAAAPAAGAKQQQQQPKSATKQQPGAAGPRVVSGAGNRR